MADNVILTRIKHATGTSAEWAAKASTLFQGELGYDSSNNKVKIGNGTAKWADLPWLKADLADKATSATSARYATTATSAASATNASTASYATSAGSASSATNASTATYASSAAKATSATSARYATTATNADSASKATSATSARYATTATNAGSATNASTANYATSAGSAGSATYATYPCMTAGNEIRFHNGTGLTAGGEIWLGWAWASGDKTVTKDWRIGNFSGGGLANVYVDTLYGNVSGNVNGYTSTAGTASYATSAGSAGSATSASKATSATSARYATTATNAGTATYSSKSASATSARYATTATNAGTASYSNNGAKAASATSARYATTATSAGSATNASTATYASSAGGVSGMTDYVIAQYITDTSGSWSYRKWKSGIAECWMRTGQYYVSSLGAWGSMYVVDNIIPQIAYPFTFKSLPVVEATYERQGGAGDGWLFSGTWGETTMTPAFGYMRPTNNSAYVSAFIYVIGRV